MIALVTDFPDTILYPDMAGDNWNVSGWSPYSTPMVVSSFWYEDNECPLHVPKGYLQYPEVELPSYEYNRAGDNSSSNFLESFYRLWPTKVLPGGVNRYRQDGFHATGGEGSSMSMVSGTDPCSSVAVCCRVWCASAIVALAFAATF